MNYPQPLPTPFPFIPKCLFTDIDDTLTCKGELPAEVVTALEQLRRAGIEVVPVTGGSGGWCDCLLRILPIRTIIGENGAIWMHLDEQGKLQRNFLQSRSRRESNLLHLADIKERVLDEVPTTRVSLDTDFRLTDIAFDIGQQRSLGQQDIKRIITIATSMGANAKASSIHVNVWYGEINKAKGAMTVLDHLQIMESEAIFIGDSPNDESMFEQFAITIGVSNITRYLDSLSLPPRYITTKAGGFGFVQLAQSLLAAIARQ